MKKIAIIGAFIFLTVFLTIIGCFSDWKGGEGTLTITLGGDSNGRAVDWPPYADVPGKFRYPMKYILTLNGPTGTIEREFGFNENDLVENVIFTFFIAPGRWNVNVKAYVADKGKFLYSTGDSNVNVRGGLDNSVGIKMNKAYYDIGDTGPGGGKIFHVNPRGFTLYLDKNDNVGIIAYYLEVAPEDCINPTDPSPSHKNFTWVSFGEADKYYPTLNAIGTGRKNTDLIISYDNDLSDPAPAANACRNYRNGGKDDWFLPSIEEIAELLINKQKVGFYNPENSCWSSSQYPIINDSNEYVYCLYREDTNGSTTYKIGVTNKSVTLFVRPIRAF